MIAPQDQINNIINKYNQIQQRMVGDELFGICNVPKRLPLVENKSYTKQYRNHLDDNSNLDVYEPNNSSNMSYTRRQSVKPKRPRDLVQKEKLLDRPDFGVQIPTSPHNTKSKTALGKNTKQH